MKPYLSVVIPTYNRADKLDQTLQYLHEQSLSADAYDIWVVDDGSSDSTPELLKEWTQKSSRVHALHQKNSGQGIARNHALKKLEGEIVLFIGDDIYGTKDFLLQHVRFHQDNPEENKACLGLTEWDPSKPVTPYMRWLTGKRGPQFAYYKLTPHEEANFWFFYTSNLSLKRSLFEKQNFDEDFKGYGWEDMELGYRLSQKENLKLIYIPEALAHHDHFMSEENLKSKMISIAKSAKIFHQKHPEVPVLPTGLKRTIQAILASPPSLAILSGLRLLPIQKFKQLYWYALSKRYFLQELKEL